MAGLGLKKRGRQKRLGRRRRSIRSRLYGMTSALTSRGGMSSAAAKKRSKSDAATIQGRLAVERAMGVKRGK